MANTVCRVSPACWHRGPRGVAPERMPKADATELTPKKIGDNLRHADPVPEGHSFHTFRISPSDSRPFALKGLKKRSPIFFGEAPERRPWGYKNAKDRPAAFAGRSTLRALPPRSGIPSLPTQTSILSQQDLNSTRRRAAQAARI